MSRVAESLLALVFGDLEAIDTPALLRTSKEKNFHDFEEWELLDLLVARFPDVGRPTLRFELREQIERCGGEPLALIHQASQSLVAQPGGTWGQRFPVSIFADRNLQGRQADFEIADPHLHSGGSVPLQLFFSILGSGEKRVDAKVLKGKTIRSYSGREWDVHTLLAATRWALRLLRFVLDDEKLDSPKLRNYHLDHSVVDMVKDESFWSVVQKEATRRGKDPAPQLHAMSRKFPLPTGPCKVNEVFWDVAHNEKYDFPGRRAFLVGLVRAFAALASFVTARPGDGLSRFVDRFDEMGIARDAALGDAKTKMTRSTLEYVANSSRVIGAEFRKTIVAGNRNAFKKDTEQSLRDHHHAFSEFASQHSRAMALSMPVGFLRKPCSGGEWTDFEQLRDAVHGYQALRLILANDDGTLAAAISSIDVAGNEDGSASWPYAAVAELLRRTGIDLNYTIHAGEAFSSQLNGVRRVGELFLADRIPQRIGHALALSSSAAQAICDGETHPPIRIGDAICDLAWTVVAGCGNAPQARSLIYDLAKGKAAAAGKALDPDAWIEAYEALFSVDELLKHKILVDRRGAVEVTGLTSRRRLAKVGSEMQRALAALAWGADASIAHAEVRNFVPHSLLPDLHRFYEATAQDARDFVLHRVREEGTIIESCPTSNVRLAKLDNIEAHPLWRWTTDGIEIVIGSDDPLIFGATITDEFDAMALLARKNGLGMACVERIAAATVASCSGNLRRHEPDFKKTIKALR